MIVEPTFPLRPVLRGKGGEDQKNRDRAVNTHEIFCRADVLITACPPKTTDLMSLKGPLLTAKKPGPFGGALIQCCMWWTMVI